MIRSFVFGLCALIAIFCCAVLAPSALIALTEED